MSQEMKALLRPNIRNLQAYSSARDEFTGKAEIYLDANENALGSVVGPFHRYPDPYQRKVKAKLAQIKGLDPEQIFLGNGSDEAIDLLFRAFCQPGSDEVILVPPTYGMYQVSAGINDIGIREVPLASDYQLDIPALKKAFEQPAKLLFICSPNNPTGNSIREADILEVLGSFPGIVVVDEAYIDFSSQPSMLRFLKRHKRLVVLQTFSKAWGLAGLRVGMAFADPSIIEVFNRIKPPYNVNVISQEKVLLALNKYTDVQLAIADILAERARLSLAFRQMDFVHVVHPSDANFLLVQLPEPQQIYQKLLDQGIVVRDRSKVLACEGCLRFTVGTPKENDSLIAALKTLAE